MSSRSKLAESTNTTADGSTVSLVEHTTSEKKPTNLNIPHHRYQIFQKSLLEHEFDRQEAFVSASLQRLQHGVYESPERLQIYGSSTQSINVTFISITFAFHAMHSVEHRFERAQISIQALGPCATPHTSSAKTYDQPLPIIKFAPHVAYGRISTENLHWTFSLGATAGVTIPYTATVTPSTEFDRSKVIGAMLKIQGSTRTSENVPSSKLVWSLEENEQQSTGLPRELTFVFLVEQTVARAPFCLQVGIKPVFSSDLGKPSILNRSEILSTASLLDHEVGQTFTNNNFNFATMKGQFESLVELPGTAASIQDLSNSIASTPVPTSAITS